MFQHKLPMTPITSSGTCRILDWVSGLPGLFLACLWRAFITSVMTKFRGRGGKSHYPCRKWIVRAGGAAGGSGYVWKSCSSLRQTIWLPFHQPFLPSSFLTISQLCSGIRQRMCFRESWFHPKAGWILITPNQSRQGHFPCQRLV